MKLLRKIKRWLNRVPYIFAFGMKAGDEEIMGSSSSDSSEGHEIRQVVGQRRVSKDLLRGEETEEVSQLRYKSYRVERESKNFDYIGEGTAVKKSNENFDLNNFKTNEKDFHFIQPNVEIIGSIEDEVNRVGKYGEREMTIKFKYNDFPQFRNEHFINSVKIDVNDGKTKIQIRYPIESEFYNASSKVFTNRLKMAYDKGMIHGNDAVCNFKEMSFVTLKADGEEDYISFEFYGLFFNDIRKDDIHGYYIVDYTPNYFKCHYLLSNYYNKMMSDKYSKKIKKERQLTYNGEGSEKKVPCEECGKMIDEFEAVETKNAIGKSLCIGCLSKYAVE